MQRGPQPGIEAGGKKNGDGGRAEKEDRRDGIEKQWQGEDGKAQPHMDDLAPHLRAEVQRFADPAGQQQRRDQQRRKADDRCKIAQGHRTRSTIRLE